MRLGLNLHVLSRKVPWPFFGPLGGADPAPPDGTKSALGTHLELLAPQAPSRGEGGGNVRGAAVGRPPTARRASPGAPTGWVIPPDPQQARGGKIPVR